MKIEELQDKGKELANEMARLCNYPSGQGQAAFIERMSTEHRTLQQAFTRLCLQWLEQVAERKGPQFTDLRNESSQDISEKMMNGFIQIIADQQNISVEEVKKNWDIYRPSKWLPYI